MQLKDILSLLSPETAKAVQADYGNANNLFQWGPDAQRTWQADQYGVDSLNGENATNPLVAQALGRGPANAGLMYQTPLNQWLAQNEGDWGEGYKASFQNAKYDPKYGLMLDEASGLSNYNKETGMTPEQMAILASIAVGGIIAAPASMGGAGGMSSLGTSTTLADMTAAGTYGAAPAAGVGGAAGSGGGFGGAGGVAGETGLASLPQAGTWAQTAVPGGAAPIGAGAEIGSGITTAGGGYYGGAGGAGAGGYSPSWTDVPTGTGATGSGGGGMGSGAGGSWTLKDYLSVAQPIVGGVGAILGSNAASDAAKQAAQTQQAAQDAALAEMRRQFDIGQGNLQPWLNSGKSALGQLDTLMAPGGELSQKFDLSKFQQDPGYNFQLQQGEQGVNRAAAARGGYDSGRTLKELLRYDNGLASQSYGDAYNRYNADQTNRYNRLAGIAGLGQTSANALTQNGANYGNNVANTLTAGGNAQAASQIAQGNARMSGYSGVANALSGALNNYQSNALLSQLLKGY